MTADILFSALDWAFADWFNIKLQQLFADLE